MPLESKEVSKFDRRNGSRVQVSNRKESGAQPLHTPVTRNATRNNSSSRASLVGGGWSGVNSTETLSTRRNSGSQKSSPKSLKASMKQTANVLSSVGVTASVSPKNSE